MNLKKRSAFYAGLVMSAAALAWPLAARAQQAAAAPALPEDETVVDILSATHSPHERDNATACWLRSSTSCTSPG